MKEKCYSKDVYYRDGGGGLMLKYDVVIVGGGGAGMRAALEVSKHAGISVAVFTKTFPTRSHTGAAQGGLNAALAFQDANDTPEQHFIDSVKGSDFLGDQDVIEFLVNQAPEAILELESMGVPFSRDGNGRIAQKFAGGATYPRICYSADKTGHVIIHTLFEQCLKNEVKFFYEWTILELAIDGKQLQGLVVMDIRNGEIHGVNCRALIIATGGFGRIYWARTTNAFNMTGDGTAVCFEAGIPIKDPEFIQFHPTGLRSSGILLSEVSRSEGGQLFNNKGERFMSFYAPEKMELGPRDLVSRAIETEIKEGRGFGEGINSYVYMDLRHLGKKKIMENLPQVRQLALEFEGVDILKEPVPIRPSCHYVMGGIHISDFKTSQTPIAGLHAAGECSCVSVHGANRLGGNSLAEVIVFGKVAGWGAAQSAKIMDFGDNDIIEDCASKWRHKFEALCRKQEGSNMFAIRDKMAETLWNNVGIFRTGKELEQAASTLDQLIEDFSTVSIGDAKKNYNMAFISYIEIGNLLKIAKAVAVGALARKESRGAHSRADYPERDDVNFLKHTLIYKQDEQYRVEYLPVAITRYQPEERRY